MKERKKLFTDFDDKRFPTREFFISRRKDLRNGKIEFRGGGRGNSRARSYIAPTNSRNIWRKVEIWRNLEHNGEYRYRGRRKDSIDFRRGIHSRINPETVGDRVSLLTRIGSKNSSRKSE